MSDFIGIDGSGNELPIRESCLEAYDRIDKFLDELEKEGLTEDIGAIRGIIEYVKNAEVFPADLGRLNNPFFEKDIAVYKSLMKSNNVLYAQIQKDLELIWRLLDEDLNEFSYMLDTYSRLITGTLLPVVNAGDVVEDDELVASTFPWTEIGTDLNEP